MKENKNILLVLIGPPCSGKTTFAKSFVKENNNWIRVNRDDIRLMCGNYWGPSREKLINIYEEIMVSEALQNGYNVVIDATNLNPKTKTKWVSIALKFNVEVQYREFIVSYNEAIKRDKERDLQVGEETIRRFYRIYYPWLLQQDIDEI